MIHLWNGIVLGLALSILVGPLLFALVQVSMEQGVRAGIWLALGIWLSDVLFLVGIGFSVNQISEIIESPLFVPIVGILGGIVLIIIGISMFISQPTDMDTAHFELVSSKWKLGLNGFLINTINPFTVIFWTSVITTFLVEERLYSFNSCLFFGGILGVIVLTDSLKLVLAEQISKKITPIHVAMMRKISGMALFLFGITMFARVSLGLFQ